MRKALPVIAALLALGVVVIFELATRGGSPHETASAAAKIIPTTAAVPVPAVNAAAAPKDSDSDLPTVDVAPRVIHTVPEHGSPTVIRPIN